MLLDDTAELIRGRLWLTLGSKLERNDYSSFEFQPSGRLRLTLGPRHGLWAAVTRAVRTPTRFDRDLILDVAIVPGSPVFARFLGDPGFETERSFVFEGGYRARLSPRVSLEMAGFHNRYPNLVSYELGDSFAEPGRVVFPLRAANGALGRVSGAEVNLDVQPRTHWLVRASYAYLNMQIGPQLSSNDAGSSDTEDASPRHQVVISSTTTFAGRVALDVLYRWIARLPSRDVAAYSELDLNLSWRAADHLELAIHGENLLHARHVEFSSGILGSSEGAPDDLQLRRAVRVQATIRW
jgi:iron complex outermembrane receptor protein